MIANQLIQSDDYYQDMRKILDASKDESALYSTIVNTPFHNKLVSTQLGLGIVVLLLVDAQKSIIERIALSKTSPAQGAVNASIKPFREIVIPQHDSQNLIASVIRNQKWQMTTDWYDLFVPDFTPQETHFNQAGAGIAYSVVYPLNAGDGGAMIFSYFESPDKVSEAHHTFMRRYSRLVTESLQQISAQ